MPLLIIFMQTNSLKHGQKIVVNYHNYTVYFHRPPSLGHAKLFFNYLPYLKTGRWHIKINFQPHS